MKNEKLTTQVAREARKKFPNLPSLTLARIIYKDNKELYTSVDHARTSLRSIEGKTGTKKGKERKADKSLYIDEPRPYNPYNLPNSEEEEFIPYIVPDECKRILMLYDIHIPYHNIEALTLALDYGKEKQVDTVILGGDFIDFYQLSRFDKDPRKRSFKDELEATRSFLKILREQFPFATIIAKNGNHELRLEKYLTVRAPELLGVSEFELSKLLRYEEYGVIPVADRTVIKLHALNILHGHEFQSGFVQPVNIARGLFLKANATAIQGHSHQTSENTVTTINNEMITTWSVGCLSDLHPRYASFNRWNHGFAYIEVEGTSFEVFNKRIKAGKIF